MATVVNTKDMLKNIFSAAKELFCDGIYVRSMNAHPCGWDFISFSSFDNAHQMWTDTVDLSDISDGIYDEHEYYKKSVAEILKIVGCDWCFERSGIDWA